MKNGKRDVVRVTFHGLYAALAKVVPYLDGLIVAGGDEVRLVSSWVEVDVVDTFIVCVHGEVGGA